MIIVPRPPPRVDQTPHYAMTKVPTVIQINGNGPFDINYLNPADDPAKAAKK